MDDKRLQQLLDLLTGLMHSQTHILDLLIREDLIDRNRVVGRLREVAAEIEKIDADGIMRFPLLRIADALESAAATDHPPELEMIRLDAFRKSGKED